MFEKEETQEGKVHPWVYYIGPASSSYDSSHITLYLAAFCKDCRSYYAEEIPLPTNGKGELTSSTLPRTGCKGVSLGV